MTKPLRILGGPRTVGRVHVLDYVKRHPVRIKGIAGAALWLFAALLIGVDCTDDHLGIMTGIACVALASGLALIILAVIDWQVIRLRRTMFTVVEILRRDEEPARMRLVKR